MLAGIPNDTEFGCLPRDEGVFAKCYGDGDIPTFVDEHIDIIPRADWEDDIGCEHFVDQIFDQLDGMCASNAAVSALMVSRAIAGQKDVLLAPNDVYDHVGRWNTGSTIGDNLRALIDIGVRTREQQPRKWPVQREPGWEKDARQYRIHEAIDLKGNFDAVVTAIHLRFSVVIGLRWPGGGGHAVCVTRFRNGKLRGPNSWGAHWNGDGFFELSESQCESMPRYGAFAIRAATESDADENPPEVR